MRWGEDSATGGRGADQFIIDTRHVRASDVHHILDFDSSQGDIIKFRHFDEKRIIRSEADLQDYVDNGLATIEGRSGSAISVMFQELDSNFGSDRDALL